MCVLRSGDAGRSRRRLQATYAYTNETPPWLLLFSRVDAAECEMSQDLKDSRGLVHFPMNALSFTLNSNHVLRLAKSSGNPNA